MPVFPRVRRRGWPRSLPVLHGVLPVKRSRVPSDVLAGLTLAALGIPEVLGYAKIAGMPVETGLYTMLLPMAVFAVLGSSRHLVVAADSATAAILAAALTGVAAAGSERYVRLAGLAALLAGGMLLLAGVARLGFVANFLSRTVLIGFLTGVGIQVAVGQLPDMFGVSAAGGQTPARLANLVRALNHTRWADVAVSAGVIVIVLAARRITRRIPGPLIAVVAAIVVSRAADLAARGAAVLGPVPRGLPKIGSPALGWHNAAVLVGAAASMFVVILAQSATTSRAYAAKYEEELNENTDLAALGAANVAAAFSGTFVVNGSPTKAQMVDSAGGRSQLAQLATGAVVLVVVLLLTGPLAYLPNAALAAVVFLIAAQLIDIAGLRRILAVRRHEFAVALLTTVAVVALGVEFGIVLAVVASIVDHLRHSYSPYSTVLVKSPAGHWQPEPVTPGARTEQGLVIYRFGSSLYYANASRLLDDIEALVGHGDPPRWLVLDCAAIGDVDFTASSVLTRIAELLQRRHIRCAASTVLGPVRHQLDRYGISALLGPGAYYETPGEALEAFHATITDPGGKESSPALRAAAHPVDELTAGDAVLVAECLKLLTIKLIGQDTQRLVSLLLVTQAPQEINQPLPAVPHTHHHLVYNLTQPTALSTHRGIEGGSICCAAGAWRRLPASEKPVRIGVLGAARIAPNALIKPARVVAGVEVGAIAARDRRRAEAFAARHGVPAVHDSYADLLADPSLDAVYIPLPNGLHAQWTLAALAAGKHVLCEKPFTSNAAQAREVAAAADGSGLVVMEAFHYRYHPLARRMIELVHGGELGRIQRVETAMCFPLPLFSDIRYDFSLAGGALMDAGCYAVHALRMLAPADPEVTSARALTMRRDRRIDRAMTAQFSFADGQGTGEIRASMWSSTLLRMRARAVGERGTLTVTNFTSPQLLARFTVTVDGRRRREKFGGEATYVHQLRAFAAAAAGEPANLTPPADSVATMSLIDSIYKAAGLPPRT